MALVSIILSIGLVIAYGLLFLRPRLRLLAAALMSAGLFFLYLALALAAPEVEAVNRLAIIMLGPTGLGALALAVAHMLFERGNAGAMTGKRRSGGSGKGGGAA